MNTYGYVAANPLRYTDPRGLLCTYNQSTGSMVCVNDETGEEYYRESGYAGRGEGRNNPNAQGIEFAGPIPRGRWLFDGDWFNSGITGRNTARLVPLEGNECEDTNRQCDTFRIHGNNAENDASEGCIVLPPNRTLIPPGEVIEVVGGDALDPPSDAPNEGVDDD